MKKVLAVALAAAMVVPTFAYAAPITKDNFGTELNDNLKPGADKNSAFDIVKSLAGMDSTIAVDSNIQIKLSTESSYGDNLIRQVISSSNYPSFDFLNTLDMKNVRDNVKAYAQLGNDLKAYVEDSFYNNLMASPITGEFTVKITYPSNLEISSVYTDDNQSASGFVGASAGVVNTIFKESKREVSSSGKDKLLTITMNVIDGLTCQALIDNLDTYLADMKFEVKGATPKSTGTFKVSGDVSGSVSIGDLKNQGYMAEQDQNATGDHKGLNETFKIEKKKSSGGGGSSSSGSGSVIIRPEAPDTQNVFDTENHIAYIKGYPDGSVRPNGNITREEVTTALYRLLTDSKKASIKSDVNIYTDVDADRWSNESISSMSKGGYIGGYDNATFMPEKPITRAEFATIAVRFFNNAVTNGNINPAYTDVADHWAASSIYAATQKGIVNGYEDGSFRPDGYITRAEAMTAINRLTGRACDANSLIASAKTWFDAPETEWYYYDVMEATNGHAFERRSDGFETWKELK